MPITQKSYGLTISQVLTIMVCLSRELVSDTRKHAFVLTAERILCDFSFPSGTGAESEKADVGLI